MGKKILLADDSITIQKVIELTFSDEDFDVVTVGNGRLAVEKVQEVRPDVVLCDIIMPEKDGYEVCDFVKKTPGLSHIPVLLLTGAFEPFDQDRANRVGCDGFLAKPFEPETLIAKVRDLLSRAAKPAAAAAPAHPPVPKPGPTTVVSAPAPPPAIPFVAPAREPEPFSPRSAGFVTSSPRPADPIPFPRAAAAPPPASSTFPAPAPAPEAVPVASFIPDEPFEDLDAGSLSGEETAPGSPATAAFPPPREELLPMTPEESQSLSAPPEDASSTVMFRAESLPWNAPPAPGAAAAPDRAALPVVEPAVPDVMAEVPVFEEVIEEEVEFTPAAAPLPTPVVSAPFVAPEPVPPPPPPRVVVAPPPPVAVQPPPPPPPPVAERAAIPAPPLAALSDLARAAPEPASASFADLAVGEPAAPPAAPSEAAGVAVPVEMVEKIAQRVVAQISERVVREIAWEVIPDLAEAMIRAEIERLKGELQRL